MRRPIGALRPGYSLGEVENLQLDLRALGLGGESPKGGNSYKGVIISIRALIGVF